MFIFKLETNINSTEWMAEGFCGESYRVFFDGDRRQTIHVEGGGGAVVGRSIHLNPSDVLYVMNWEGRTVDTIRSDLKVG